MHGVFHFVIILALIFSAYACGPLLCDTSDRLNRRGLIDNQHMIAAPHLLIELNDLKIAHEHATRTERLANARFVIGAVDINVAFVGVDLAAEIYARFEPT